MQSRTKRVLVASDSFLRYGGRAREADWVLFARCVLLIEQPEYQKWREGLPQPPRQAQGEFEALLRNNRQGKGVQSDRFHLLPGALTLPDLVVDFQQLITLPWSQIGNLKRLASLDSPFAEALLSRFARYLGGLERQTLIWTSPWPVCEGVSPKI